jgi:hypothetical protein
MNEPLHKPPQPPWPPTRPPPPVPPGEDALLQLRELIELLQRNVRFLMDQNTSLLDMLKKYQEKMEDFLEHVSLQWSFGAAVVFTHGEKIPQGWWQNHNPTAVPIEFTHAGTHHAPSVDAYDFIFSDGEAEAGGNFQLVPLNSTIVYEEDDE